MSIIIQAVATVFAELLKLFNANQLTQKTADAAVAAFVAALKPVGDPS